jgi:hypothetical protein
MSSSIPGKKLSVAASSFLTDNVAFARRFDRARPFFRVYRRSFPAVRDIRDCEVGFRYNLSFHQVFDTNISKTLSTSFKKGSFLSFLWSRLQRELALPLAGLTPAGTLTSVAACERMNH